MKDDAQKKTNSHGWISSMPLPNSDELRKFYAELYYQSPQSSSYQKNYEDIELDYKSIQCNALLYSLSSHGITGGTFLDIGAGEGFLMSAAANHGFAVTGMDFSSFGIEKFFPDLTDKFIRSDVFDGINRLKSEGRAFSVCAAINVLEHVRDPSLFMSAIKDVMLPNAVLAVTVPNDYSCIQQLLMKEGLIDREFWFVPPQHLHYFNSNNLPMFCRSEGYDVLDAFSDFPIDLFLLHPGSNYVMDARNGPSAHRARVLHDLMIAKAGWDNYLNFYRAMFRVGIGRDITLVLRRRED